MECCQRGKGTNTSLDTFWRLKVIITSFNHRSRSLISSGEETESQRGLGTLLKITQQVSEQEFKFMCFWLQICFCIPYCFWQNNFMRLLTSGCLTHLIRLGKSFCSSPLMSYSSEIGTNSDGAQQGDEQRLWYHLVQI